MLDDYRRTLRVFVMYFYSKALHVFVLSIKKACSQEHSCDGQECSTRLLVAFRRLTGVNRNLSKLHVAWSSVNGLLLELPALLPSVFSAVAGAAQSKNQNNEAIPRAACLRNRRQWVSSLWP